MSQGGARKNSGRKPGSATKKTREVADAAMATGLTPLEYMISVMRGVDPLLPNKTDADKAAQDLACGPSRRDAMALASAKYCHPSMASIEYKGDANQPIKHEVTWKLKFVDPEDDPTSAAA